jgi:polysaccharide pyruvyl transferase WcaK-like protein
MNFEDISVREKEVADYLNQNFKLDKSVKLVLDPTLTVDKSVWEKMKTGKFSDEKYVLVYAARIYQKDPNAIMNQAKSIADKLGCKVKILDLHTATDFVDLISNAQYVLSSSYHGVVFSLIFNKPLYAILYGDNQDKRYYNLLHLVGAERMLANIDDDVQPQMIDYPPINEKISKLALYSKNFLKQI